MSGLKSYYVFLRVFNYYVDSQRFIDARRPSTLTSKGVRSEMRAVYEYESFFLQIVKGDGLFLFSILLD